jgi:hypothetical protein
MTSTSQPSANSLPLPTVVVLNRDLFFGVRIGNILKSAGFEPKFVKTTTELTDLVQNEPSAPALIIVDIGANPDWDQVGSLSTKTPILAFGPHKDVESLRAAKTAGVTRVVSNSEFHRNALELIQRYATSAP